MGSLPPSQPRTHRVRARRKARAALGVLLSSAFGLGCAQLGLGPQSPAPVVEMTARKSTAPPPKIDLEVYRRAEAQRTTRFLVEIERLRADLQQAEEALVMAESGLRGTHTRADAVSRLAEVRIMVERAGVSAPWRAEALVEARGKLEEASSQIAANHFGAALFFVYRAERIAQEIEAEAEQVYETAGTRFVRAQRVNLRAGPSTEDRILAVLAQGTPVFPEDRSGRWVLVRTASGSVGWVHVHLLADQVLGSVSSEGSSVEATTQSRPAALAR